MPLLAFLPIHPRDREKGASPERPRASSHRGQGRRLHLGAFERGVDRRRGRQGQGADGAAERAQSAPHVGQGEGRVGDRQAGGFEAPPAGVAQAPRRLGAMRQDRRSGKPGRGERQGRKSERDVIENRQPGPCGPADDVGREAPLGLGEAPIAHTGGEGGRAISRLEQRRYVHPAAMPLGEPSQGRQDVVVVGRDAARDVIEAGDCEGDEGAGPDALAHREPGRATPRVAAT